MPDGVEFVFAMNRDVFEREHLVTGFEFVEAGVGLAINKRQAFVVIERCSSWAAFDL